MEPLPPLKIQCSKRRKRQLLGHCVLHSKTIAQRVALLRSEGLGEDINSLFSRRAELEVDDPLVHQISDVVHVDLYVLHLLPLYWISAEL